MDYQCNYILLSSYLQDRNGKVTWEILDSVKPFQIKIIPHAIFWFTGEAVQQDSFEGLEEDEYDDHIEYDEKDDENDDDEDIEDTKG